jgi:hypothetical protein
MARSNGDNMSTTAWIWTLVVLAIPLVNLIMYIVWACGVGNRNRVTFCRAAILLTLVGLVILIGLHLAGALTALTMNGWKPK